MSHKNASQIEEKNASKYKGKIICVEGNIGVGKSTLCKQLKEILESHGVEVVFFPEPFNQKMLEQFLGNQRLYAYAFQLYMLTRRQVSFVEALHYAASGKCCIIDRSLMGDHVFADVQKELGNMTEDEYDVYSDVYNSFSQFKPHYTIYLNAHIDKIVQRIMSRDRHGEDKYEIYYLKMVSCKYKDHLYSEENVDEWDWDQFKTRDEVEKLILNHYFVDEERQ